MRLTSGINAFCRKSNGGAQGLCVPPSSTSVVGPSAVSRAGSTVCRTSVPLPAVPTRSEEHTSELQLHVNLVCRLLLEKKKKHQIQHLRNKKKKNNKNKKKNTQKI